MNDKKCKICGKQLKLGRFAYNQDTCWECFKMEVDAISEQVSKQSDKDLIHWLKTVIAELYREKL